MLTIKANQSANTKAFYNSLKVQLTNPRPSFHVPGSGSYYCGRLNSSICLWQFPKKGILGFFPTLLSIQLLFVFSCQQSWFAKMVCSFFYNNMHYVNLRLEKYCWPRGKQIIIFLQDSNLDSILHVFLGDQLEFLDWLSGYYVHGH